MIPFVGCSGCASTAGVAGCPYHGSQTTTAAVSSHDHHFVSEFRRMLFDANNLPLEGEVIDDDGYYAANERPRWWMVDGIELDPNAVWEAFSYLDAPREIRPKTVVIRMRPATEAEVAKAQDSWKDEGDNVEANRSAITSAFDKLLGR